MEQEQTHYSVAEIAERLGGRLVGPPDTLLCGINTLRDASEREITFIADRKHAGLWARSRAGAAVVTEAIEVSDHDPSERALVYVADAELATIELLQLWEPPPPLPDLGVHPTAFVHPSVRLGEGVRIGAHVSVDQDCTIGAGTVLHAGVRIYGHAAIGENCVLHANCVVRERCTIGREVILHQNVSIGADGFGYRPAPDGSGLRKVPQIGTVEIQDRVEIGANSCVDRGKFGATVIGEGTKIDNLCQIAHNCRIGRSCIIAGLCGLAGSVNLEDGVVLGGQVGVADHLTIGKGAMVAAKSGVTRNIPPSATWYGYPADDMRKTLRRVSALHKLPDHLRDVSRLLQTGKR
ncbi:MAG: UDP-3-O-(3-hydroxymyristoyl)glucosamine N-acyltransferase [Phycisphaerales bacterium]|nr:MAG: UDP-3-O-(3-hydroxymyristoyl)glucosamine N-acyltransferase [Phycisphaerales bacterium]